MNKTELVAKVADITGVGRNDVRAVIDCCFDTITNVLEMDGKVSLAGFGTFSVVEKEARTGINPQTKEKIQIPARKVVKFKPAAELAK